MDFDDILARHAVKHGAAPARAHQRHRPGARRARGAIVGVTARAVDDERPQRRAESVTYRAPLVVAADGNSSRLVASRWAGQKRDDRPMGVAVRTYYTSPRTDDDYLESWLELWVDDRRTAASASCCPATAGSSASATAPPTSASGILNTSTAFGKVDYKDVMRRWVATMPEEWTYNDETMVGPIRGAALPMGFNRKPHYADGLLLVGDAGGMVNPFNGEGIAYAMESGRLAAEVIAQAFARPDRRRARAGPAVIPARS